MKVNIFNKIVKEQINKCLSCLERKGKEYSSVILPPTRMGLKSTGSRKTVRVKFNLLIFKISYVLRSMIKKHIQKIISRIPIPLKPQTKSPKALIQ